MKIKAMVTKIDITKGTMVVLTEDRQFKILPLPEIHPLLGSTIEIPVPHEKSSLRSFANPRWLSVAAVLFICFIGLFGYFGSSQAATYVALDMKPSIQLAVNNNGQITKVSTLNEDGTRVINQLHLESKNLYQAVKEIIKQAGKEGCFDKNEENLVMAVYAQTKESGFPIDKARLLQVINDELKNNLYPGYVVINKVDWETWQEARDAGYSANKLIVMEGAKKHGMTLDQGTLNHGDMMQVIKNSNISVPQLFPQSSFHVMVEDRDQAAKTDNSPGMMDSVDNSMHSQKMQSVPTNSDKINNMHSQSSSKENGSTDMPNWWESEKTDIEHMGKDMGIRGMMTDTNLQSDVTSTIPGSIYSNMPHR